MSILEVTLLGLLAGTLGTAIGGVIAIMLTRINPVQISALLGLSAGIMIAIVTFELMPEALEDGGLFWGLAGLVAGVILMASIDIVFPHIHMLGTEEQSPYLKTGVIMGLGIGMHNLPEGLAIGVSGMQDPYVGIALAFAIFLHNIPEGMALAMPLNICKVRAHKIIFSAMAVGVPMGFGAFIGGLAGTVSPVINSLVLGLAAGAMLFITFDELIPQTEKLSKGHSGTFGVVAGVVAGIVILAVIPH